MLKGKVSSTHHATDATWSKSIALITQQVQMGNSCLPGLLEIIMDCPEAKNFGITPEEEVMHADVGPPYNELPENEKMYVLFTGGSCHTLRNC